MFSFLRRVYRRVSEWLILVLLMWDIGRRPRDVPKVSVDWCLLTADVGACYFLDIGEFGCLKFDWNVFLMAYIENAGLN